MGDYPEEPRLPAQPDRTPRRPPEARDPLVAQQSNAFLLALDRGGGTIARRPDPQAVGLPVAPRTTDGPSPRAAHLVFRSGRTATPTLDPASTADPRRSPSRRGRGAAAS